MLESLSRYWWVIALRGLFAVAFGAFALLKPDSTLSALVLLFGTFALVDGVFSIAGARAGGSSDANRRRSLLVEGIVGIAAGVITFIWPNVTVFVLLWLIGVPGRTDRRAADRHRREATARNKQRMAAGA
jgi:uncharacterized membrane protein HdeD (DUF308 family)